MPIEAFRKDPELEKRLVARQQIKLLLENSKESPTASDWQEALGVKKEEAEKVFNLFPVLSKHAADMDLTYKYCRSIRVNPARVDQHSTPASLVAQFIFLGAHERLAQYMVDSKKAEPKTFNDLGLDVKPPVDAPYKRFMDAEMIG